MRVTVQAFNVEDLVPGRLSELVDARTPWHRSLWQAGSILMLREILEYADGFRAGAMRPEGLQYVCGSAKEQVARDWGLGAEPIRNQILKLLESPADKQKGLVQLHVADSLEQLTRRAERGYLRRWATAVRQKDVGVADGELLARLVAGHLLDAGFSANHVHGWLKAKSGAALVDLLEQADDMCGEDAVAFEVLVPFDTLPKLVAEAAGSRFRTAEATEAFLEERGAPPPPGRRGTGSLTFSVTAREPWSAVAAADIDVRRLTARVVVGLRSEKVVAQGNALVLDSVRSKWRPLKSRQKEIVVSTIARKNLLLPAARADTNHELDDAFELLAAVETSTSWASVAAIWAAVEGLLARVTDSGAAAADRMAAVVTAGYVRAELVHLATVLKDLKGPVAENLLDETTPFAMRLDRLFEVICQREDLPELELGDRAAVMRLQTIFEAPAVLKRIEGYLAASFRRLFQQRNLLLHGGRFDSVALPLTMRSVPILVGAGLDRLVYAVTEDNAPPLALAARASNELGLVGSDGARRLHRLLD